MKTLYTYSSVVEFINNTLIPAGYEIVIKEGVLVDSFFCIAPDEKHYNFIFRETYINEWSSGLSQRKCQKLSKAVQKEIDEILSGE